jgi:hypothetical protein
MEAGELNEWRLQIQLTFPGAQLIGTGKGLWISARFSKFVIDEHRQILVMQATQIEPHLFNGK